MSSGTPSRSPKPSATKEALRRRVGREAIKWMVSALVRWEPLVEPQPGFSIVLGVPWDLRHLLSVNLRFVEHTDLADLRRIHVVFDRCRRPEMDEITRRISEQFPRLPLAFLHYPNVSGRIVERVHVSTFYNSMNTVLALRECDTRYAVLHDFDLYPVRTDHFTSIIKAMRENTWRFSGHELTFFDGLKEEDLQIGTWTLGIDVEWLRRTYRPVDCFHRVTKVGGRLTNLDPYAHIQTRTPERGLAGSVRPDEFCHVRNLCSTYLRFLKGAPLKVAWRLHYLWYLEDLAGMEGRIAEVSAAMDNAAGPAITVNGKSVSFGEVHVTSANVLRTELMQMERFLFGEARSSVLRYLNSFDSFLWKHGRKETVYDEKGEVRWTLKTA